MGRETKKRKGGDAPERLLTVKQVCEQYGITVAKFGQWLRELEDGHGLRMIVVTDKETGRRFVPERGFAAWFEGTGRADELKKKRAPEADES